MFNRLRNALPIRSTLKKLSAHSRAGLSAAFALIILLGIWLATGNWYRQRLETNLRTQANLELSLRAKALSSALNRRFALLEGLDAFVRTEPVDAKFRFNFETFAAGLYASTPGIRTLAVAPGGVVHYVYPVDGEVKALGYDPLQDPREEVRADVEKAIQTQGIIVGGPGDLLEGGSGIIARKAIFTGDSYWGLVTLVIDIQPIMARAGIDETDTSLDMVVQDMDGQVFFGDESVLQNNPVSQRIDLPDGYWELYGAPPRGWAAAVIWPATLFQTGSLVIVLLSTMLVYLTVNRQGMLAAAVRERTLELTSLNTRLQQDIRERLQAEAKLSERESQYHRIFESVSDGLFINDLEGNLVDFNTAAALMHGYTPEEFQKLQPSDFIHPDSLEVFNNYLEAINRGEPFRGREINLRKDGSTMHVDVTGAQFIYQGKPHTLAVIRDISAEVEAFQLLEKRVAERTRDLAALLEVSRSLATTLEVKPLSSLILDQLRRIVDFSAAGLLVLEGDDLLLLDYIGWPDNPQPAHIHRYASADYSLYRAVIERKEPVISPDISSNQIPALLGEDPASTPELIPIPQAGTWMGVPLMVKGRMIGFLHIEHPQPAYYQEEDATLVSAYASQAALAMENARLYQQAQVLASLEERQKLARELHDSVSQALYGIGLGARTARKLADRRGEDPSALIKALDYILDLAEAGLVEMRTLIFELRPESLEREGLITALERLANALKARYQLNVHTDFCPEPSIPLHAKEALYRIIQEATHNTVKHAQATQISIELVCDSAALQLTISDNGQGFDSQTEFPGHLGLASMRERAEQMGGTFDLDSLRGGGTRIAINLPLSGLQPPSPYLTQTETTGIPED